MANDIMIAGIAAFCNGNYGIGKDGHLPWPNIKEDHEFYTGLCKTTKDPMKINGIITGRNGWKKWTTQKKSHPKMSTVVISNSLPQNEPYCRGVARNLDEAIDMFLSGPESKLIETIYILGGRQNYEEAVNNRRCCRLIMTRIFQDFQSDVFFPQFEDKFHRVRHPEIDEKIREDPTNGIKFRFEVWVRNTL